MRRIDYIQSGMGGKPPVEEFIDSLDEKTQKKVLFVFGLAKDCGLLPTKFFKKLSGTDGLWELRIKSDGEIFRLLCFWGHANTLVLTHGFKKKTQKTPKDEIEIAQRWKKMYFLSNPKP